MRQATFGHGEYGMIYDVQKAGVLKRFSAFLLDFILLCVLAAGFAFLLAWITQVDKYTDTLHGYYEEYGQKYGVDFDISAEDYNKLTDEQKDVYQEAYSAIFSENRDAAKAYKMSIMLPILITTISLLLSYIILEFVVPLCLKNGQTVGKKVFSLGVVFNNSVRITTFALFVRAILGKYTIGTMFPVMLIMLMLYQQMGAIIVLVLVAALVILQLALFIFTKTHSFIHDILASTVVVDLSSQMIFESTQELIAYKEQLSREQAEREGKTHSSEQPVNLDDVPVGEEQAYIDKARAESKKSKKKR